MKNLWPVFCFFLHIKVEKFTIFEVSRSEVVEINMRLLLPEREGEIFMRSREREVFCARFGLYPFADKQTTPFFEVHPRVWTD